MSCCSLEKKICSDMNLSIRPTLQHRKKLLCIRPITGICGTRAPEVSKVRVTWNNAPPSEMQQNRLEKAQGWEPGDLASSSYLPVSNLFYDYRGALHWACFPNYAVYKLDYVNFSGLCSFRIQWVFEVKKSNELYQNQKLTFVASPIIHINHCSLFDQNSQMCQGRL